MLKLTLVVHASEVRIAHPVRIDVARLSELHRLLAFLDGNLPSAMRPIHARGARWVAESVLGNLASLFLADQTILAHREWIRVARSIDRYRFYARVFLSFDAAALCAVNTAACTALAATTFRDLAQPALANQPSLACIRAVRARLTSVPLRQTFLRAGFAETNQPCGANGVLRIAAFPFRNLTNVLFADKPTRANPERIGVASLSHSHRGDAPPSPTVSCANCGRHAELLPASAVRTFRELAYLVFANKFSSTEGERTRSARASDRTRSSAFFV